MTSTNDVLLTKVPAAPIASRADFQEAVRGFLLNAEAAGVRELWWLSPDFSDWPLDEPPLIDALTHWAKLPGARITWLAHDFERVRRVMPRITRWRQTFSHVLNCRSPEELPGSDMPTLLVADHRAALRVLDLERMRGWVSHNGADVQRAREEIDAILQRSVEAFPSAILGL